MTDDEQTALVTDPAYVPPRQAPVAPYLSNQIGCSELAPLMVALGTWGELPECFADWFARSAERSALPKSRMNSAPDRLKFPALSPVWCADRARKVHTEYGELPEIIASKAGAIDRPDQLAYQKAGVELEPVLWGRWLDQLRDDEQCMLDVDSLTSQHDILARYPSQWEVRAPSVRHKVESRLVTYLDGWGVDMFGEMVVVNCKLSRDWKDAPDVPAWVQMQGELACTRAAVGVLVYGQRWNADYIKSDPQDRGPVTPFPVHPDMGAERAILATVKAAWDVIDGVRAEMAAKKGRQ